MHGIGDERSRGALSEAADPDRTAMVVSTGARTSGAGAALASCPAPSGSRLARNRRVRRTVKTSARRQALVRAPPRRCPLRPCRYTCKLFTMRILRSHGALVPSLHPPFRSVYSENLEHRLRTDHDRRADRRRWASLPADRTLIRAPAHDLVFDATGHERHQRPTARRDDQDRAGPVLARCRMMR